MRNWRETIRGAVHLLQLWRLAFDEGGGRFDRAIDARNADLVAAARQPYAAAGKRILAIAEAHQAILAERPPALVSAGGFRIAHDPSVGHIVLDVVLAVIGHAAQRVANDRGLHLVDR